MAKAAIAHQRAWRAWSAWFGRVKRRKSLNKARPPPSRPRLVEGCAICGASFVGVVRERFLQSGYAMTAQADSSDDGACPTDDASDTTSSSDEASQTGSEDAVVVAPGACNDSSRQTHARLLEEWEF